MAIARFLDSPTRPSGDDASTMPSNGITYLPTSEIPGTIQHARKLRLLFTDYSNQIPSIPSIKARAPARHLVFELKGAATEPMRLFFGYPKATGPHYDFEKHLPARLSKDAVRTEVSAIANNPDYRPEPLPFTERVPWLIYVVLAVSSLALAIILVSLARTTLRTKPQPREESNIPDSTG